MSNQKSGQKIKFDQKLWNVFLSNIKSEKALTVIKGSSCVTVHWGDRCTIKWSNGIIRIYGSFSDFNLIWDRFTKVTAR